jgi:hypothetical protein
MRLAVALFSLLVWRSAFAGCTAAPAVEFAPASGAVLTTHPTVYIFLRRPSQIVPEIDARVDGVSVPARSELLIDEPDRLVVAAHIAIATATKLAVTFAGASASYRISSAKPSTEEQETRITHAEFLFASGCPGANGFLLTVRPPAPAYRLEWTDKQGKTRRAVVPPLWARRRAQLAFGSIGCFAHALDAPPFDVSIEPLFADGREGEAYIPGCRSAPPRRLKRGEMSASASCASTTASFRGPVHVGSP